MKITTNNHVRFGKYYPHGMNPREKKQVESAYGGLIELEDAEFVFYRGEPYYMGDCTRLSDNNVYGEKWHGYFGESFFSAILVRITDDCDGYIFGHVYS